MSTTETSVANTQDKVTISTILRAIASGFRNFFSVSTFFVAFKYIAFVGFTFISAVLSVNMFGRLSSAPIEQFALIGLAVTLEFFKIFSIVRGNTLWRLKLKSQATRAYLMYAILAIVAVMASYGFTLTVINRNIEIGNTSTIQLAIDASKKAQAQYTGSLQTLQTAIDTNNARLKLIPPDFTSAAQTLNATITKQMAAQADIQAKLSAEQTNELTLDARKLEATKAATSTASMFKLMSDGFKFIFPKITENSLMLFLLLLISIIIELGIISTSPAIPIDQKHLKHFLDEMSAHKAEELLAEVQGRKKKDLPRRTTFAGRIAQWLVNMKKDVYDVQHPEPPKMETQSAPKPTKLAPTETTAIASVPVRKAHEREHIEPSEPWPRPEAKNALPKNESTIPMPPVVPPKAEPVAETKEAVSKDPTFSEPSEKPAIPVRPTPTGTTAVFPASGGGGEPAQSPIAPMLVAEAKIYRFGKTTEAVKDMFITFVQNLFKNVEADQPLNDVGVAAASAGIAPNLANTFVARLLDIKGSREGVTLVSRGDDGKLRPNYSEGYIISYATAEPSRERTK